MTLLCEGFWVVLSCCQVCLVLLTWTWAITRQSDLPTKTPQNLVQDTAQLHLSPRFLSTLPAEQTRDHNRKWWTGSPRLIWRTQRLSAGLFYFQSTFLSVLNLSCFHLVRCFCWQAKTFSQELGDDSDSGFLTQKWTGEEWKTVARLQIHHFTFTSAVAHLHLPKCSIFF